MNYLIAKYRGYYEINSGHSGIYSEVRLLNILGSGLTFNAYDSQWEEDKTVSINNKSEMVTIFKVM